MVRVLFILLLSLSGFAKIDVDLTIKRIEDEKTFVVITYQEKLKLGQRFSIHSEKTKEIIGLAELINSTLTPAGYTENYFILLRVLNDQMILIID